MKKTATQPEPPLILAIETATMCGSVALISRDRCLAEYSVDTATTHSRRLIRQVDRVMQATGTDWQRLDGIAVSLGPGSFTGLRIGLSTAKGLAMAADRPLLGVPTLDGLARQIVAPPGSLVCALLDARKKEVYGAFYRCNREGIPIKTGKDLVLKPEKLAELIDEPVLLVGDGGPAYGDLFRNTLGGLAIFAPVRTFSPRAATIGLLGAEMFAANDFVDPADVVPIYVRPSEAELTIGKKS
ncbi:MAG: tRNA (adenosine(37)-N6)-threonylcarbamoyltransferase complex dimerization subunit type 1 TsaB [Desulfurivibrionaceae bacterium]|nr:tRNA (adenosine(37)-N6)-threonylcarbamoyltransferase complex dimerization subunit type 1 TsaB [Desulfobulbales bacterium]MDT8334197.1 tRNA (adenosine(37)-N6)-threonylcarbamoyltransferase complex dimerization subunit type 1 TsaB [Desulfurivibrionaceae bacterium]